MPTEASHDVTRVLVVDDTPANLRLLSHVLKRGGFAVETATNAAEAFIAIEQFSPAVVLLDLQLPGVDGFTVARRLKSAPETRGSVIVAVTAYAMSGDEERARAAGCDGYVTKPIDTRALTRVVAEALAQDGRGRPRTP
jgi:CheY-like chemotaxis protein